MARGSSSSGSVLGGIFTQSASEETTIINALFETRKIDRLMMTTEINPSLLFSLACLETIAEEFNSPILRMFAKKFYQLQISKDRKGRIELVEALLSMRKTIAEEED